MNSITLSFILLVIVLPASYGSHFRGGSMNWKPIGNNQIQLNYNVGFKLDHTEPRFDPCTAEAQQKRTELHTSGKLMCDSCTSDNATAQLNWICDDFDVTEDSSVGHNSLIYNIPPGLQELDISYEHCCWIALQSPIDRYGGAKGWKMLTHVDVQPRPDNDQINSSPVTAPIPVERFHKGCDYLLQIPVSDPDDDATRCRYADKSKDECPGDGNTKACGPPTDGVIINKRSCTIKLNTTNVAEGYHAVNVIVEDYIRPVKRKSKPLSKISLLFLLQVEGGDEKCSKPTIVDPPSCKSIRPGEHFEMIVLAEAADATKPISKIKSQKPYGMTSTDIEDGVDSSGRKQITLSWDPTSADTGEHTACVSALDSDRFTSGLSCTYIYVDDNPLQAIPEGSYPAISEEIGAGKKWVVQFNKQIKRPKKSAFIKIVDPVSGITAYEIDAKSLSVSFNDSWIEFIPPKEALLSDASTMSVSYQVELEEGVALPRSSGCGSETLQWSVIVTDVDKESPVILDIPDNILKNTDVGLSSATVSWTEPTASDNSESVTITSSHTPGSSFFIGDTTVTYTAVDPSSNTVTASFIVTIQDKEVPVISGLPENIVQDVDTGSITTAVSWMEPTAIDNSGSVTLTTSHNPGDSFNVGDTIVTYTAVDPYGNEDTKSFTITVVDAEDPVIMGNPGNKIQATDPGLPTAAVSWTEPTTSDNSGSVTLTSSHNPGDPFPIGDTTVTYSAVDPYGNEDTVSFTVTIEDAEDPIIIGNPGNKNQATDPGLPTAAVSWTEPTASDNSGSVTVTSSHKPGDLFPLGDTLVIYTAIDPYGNEATESFTVTVEDTEDPNFAISPGDKKQTTDPGSATAGVSWVEPTANDNSGSITVTSSHSPGDSFPIGDTTVTYTAVDPSGNENTKSFSVSIEDTEDPVLLYIPGDKNKPTDPGSSTAVVSWTEPTASDNSGSVTLTSSHSPGDSFPIGDTTVTYTATDPYGNKATKTFTVTVKDSNSPVIVNFPDDITQRTDPGLPSATVSWNVPTASDNSGSVRLTSNHNSGDNFPIGDTTVTYTATDMFGNQETESFTVTVRDKEAPVIAGLPGMIVQNTDIGSPSAVVSWPDPVPSDNSGFVTMSSSNDPGDTFPIGDTRVSYTAVDPYPNQVTISFVVTIKDNKDPLISNMPNNKVQPTDPGSDVATVTWTVPTASDNSGLVTLTPSHTPGDTFPIGDTTVSYTATDPDGNAVSNSFTVTVYDIEPPVISGLSAEKVIFTDPGSATAIGSWSEPTATDNVGHVTLTSSDDPGAEFPLGGSKVTYTAVDPYGNQATATMVVTVIDLEAPDVSNIPTNIEQNTDPGANTATVSWAEPTASDNSGSVTLTSSHKPGDSFPIGDTTVTYTATDDFGNTDTSSFIVTVNDKEVPVISGIPENIEQDVDAGSDTAIVSWVVPTSTDNSGSVTMTASHNSGDSFPIGDTTVTYTAVDPYGNEATKSFTVTVNPKSVKAAEVSAPATWMPAMRSQYQCDAVDLVFQVPSQVAGDGEDCFLTMTDNQVTISEGFVSTRVQLCCQKDCGALFANLQGDKDVETGPPGKLPAGPPSGSILGNKDGETSPPGNLPVGPPSGSASDNEDPLISNMPNNKVQPTDPGSDVATVTWAVPTATDNSGSVTLIPSHNPGDTFPIGDTTVSYTATDPDGNAVSNSFTVTIYDIEPPVISGLSAEKIIFTDPGSATAIGSWSEPTATDNVGYVTLTSSHDPGAEFPIGGSMVTYTAVDPYGNQATASMVVTVMDLEAPVVSNIPANIEQNTEPGSNAATVSWAEPTTSDNSGSVTLTSSHKPGDSFPIGDTTVTYTATDDFGNTDTGSFIVTVNANQNKLGPPERPGQPPAEPAAPSANQNKLGPPGPPGQPPAEPAAPSANQNKLGPPGPPGQPPAEPAAPSANGCKSGWPIVNRAGPDSPGWTMVSPDQQFLCSGTVTKWTFQGKRSKPWRAIVFRPTEGSVTEFQIVGINDIPAGAVNTPVDYTVPESERIPVKSGDVIGWSFGGGVITWNRGGSYKVRWVRGNLHAGLAVNQTVNIKAGVQLREYSIEATVDAANQNKLRPPGPPGQPPAEPAAPSSDGKRPGCRVGQDDGHEGTGQGEDPGCKDQGDWADGTDGQDKSGGKDQSGGTPVAEDKPGEPSGAEDKSGRPSGGKGKTGGASSPGCRVGHVDGHEGTGQGEDPGCKDQGDWADGTGSQDNTGGSPGGMGKTGGPPGGKDQADGKSSAEDKPGGASDGKGKADGKSSAEDKPGGASDGKGKADGKSSAEDKSGGASDGKGKADGKSSAEDKSGGASDGKGKADGKSSAEDKSGGASDGKGKADGKSSAEDKSGGASDGKGKTDGKSSAEDKYGGSSDGKGKADGKSSAEDKSGGSYDGKGKSSAEDKSGRKGGGGRKSSAEDTFNRPSGEKENSGGQPRLPSALTDLPCSAGWSIVKRNDLDNNGQTMVATGQPITCDGVVRKWQYQTKTSNPFRVIIWRPISGSRFEIVGINDIPAGPTNQEVTYVIPPSDRIEVQQGDLIGWSFGPAVLPSRRAGVGNLVRWVGGNQYLELREQQVVDIDGGSGNREYSIKAIIGPNKDNSNEMYGFFLPEK
ncbi:uncharacterized protein [Amphiura filiformis]|uniref:uncharacterized protein isoform X4 n=1 Tax=Amphiura filiformis TaxID=82378 RepID=UPI003B227A98